MDNNRYQVVFKDGKLIDKKIRKTNPIIMVMHDKELLFKSRGQCAKYLFMTSNFISNHMGIDKPTKEGYYFREAIFEEQGDFQWDGVLGAYVKWGNYKYSQNKIIK